MKDLIKKAILEHSPDSWEDLRNPLRFEEFADSLALAIERSLYVTAKKYPNQNSVNGSSVIRGWDA